MKIKVVDAPMGVGKTTALMNMIKNSESGKRFIYVTPYLTEVDRVINELEHCHFDQPDAKKFGTKKRALEFMVRNNRNIVTTHALFDQQLDKASFEEISKHHYTLVMDEVSTPIEQMQMYARDMEFINEITTTDSNNIMHLKPDCDYPLKGGRFSDEVCAIRSGNVFRLNGGTMICRAPIEMFGVFDDIYVATYMFDCQIQKYYFDMFGVDYEYLYVQRSEDGSSFLVKDPLKYDTATDLGSLITIHKGRHNNIGNEKFSLSKTWYEKNLYGEKLQKLMSNCRGFFRSVDSASKDALWCEFADFERTAYPHGYKSAFLACNARATNKYSDRTSVAYLINMFCNVSLKSYFSIHNITIDDDRYALSEMLQFIWRSAIREGKPINLYVPSARMRGLLTNYIGGESA